MTRADQPSIPKNQDPSSIYYIHPAENSNVSLVSEKFSGENYGEWKRGMTIALAAKNKLSFVDGSLEQPSTDHADYKAWERCNSLIISYLLNSVDSTIARSVLYFNSATEIWKDLEDRYDQSSGPQLFKIQQGLADLYQGNMSIAEYFTKMKAIWDQINGINPISVCTCNRCSCNLTKKFLKAQQDERLIHFLMRLNTGKYAGIRTNILMMQPLPTAAVAYRLLVQEERQQAIAETGTQGDTVTFANSLGPVLLV